MKIKTVLNDSDSIQTERKTVRRVKILNHLGFVIDQNLYWNAHVDYISASLVKYFGMSHHINSFITLPIARQLSFAFINFCISCGTEVYRRCASEYRSKLQTLPNKRLKRMLTLYTSTNLLHRTSTNHCRKYVMSTMSMCCAWWTTLKPLHAQIPFVIITKFTKLNINFVNKTTMMYHDQKLKLTSCNAKEVILRTEHFTPVNSHIYKKNKGK